MEVPVEKIADEQAGNLLGAIVAANVAQAPKKTPPNVTFRNKTAQAVTGLAHADPITGRRGDREGEGNVGHVG